MRAPLRSLGSLALLNHQSIDGTLLKFLTTSCLAEARYPSAGALQHDQPSEPTKPPQEDLVKKILGPDVMSNKEGLQTRLRQLQKDFQRFEGDTGSPEVQVALLSAKIQNLSEHMRTHRKDFGTRRGLEGMLNKRRKLMQYFRRTDFDAYSVLLVRLGLKDSFVKLDRFMLQHQESLDYKQKKSRKK